MALGTDGLRGELTLVRAARSLASLDGAEAVNASHLKRLAPSALRHRLRRDPLDEAGSTVRVERAMTEVFAE
jgi:magnesium chelatase subunit I